MIINTHFPGIPVQDNVAAQFCAVLVSDDRPRSYRVYVGIVAHCGAHQNRRNAAAEWVATRGTKLRYRDALQHFPGLKENEYA